MDQLSPAFVGEKCAEVLERVALSVVGKQRELRLVLAGILAGGHVLLEDMPGLGKTLTARSFAQVLGFSFRRLQFTPDLLPADVTGAYIYNQRLGEFEFRRGPIFTNLLLADEINRTPPRTQAALLEAMQERQVTVEGNTTPLEEPFHVLATANPIEYEGTYPLPEAQLDRFLLRISFGYLSAADEAEVVLRRIARHQEEQTLEAVVDSATLLEMQRTVEEIVVDTSVVDYMVALGAATREHPHVLVGASPRGALALMLASRATAAIDGREFVTPDDVKDVAAAALAHRITLRPETYLHRISREQVIRTILEQVPVPESSSLPEFT